MTHVTSRSEIPAAPYYVLSNDSFLKDTLIFPCENYAQAQYVQAYAQSRSDQKNVRIVSNKPTLKAYVDYTLHTADDYDTWYTAEVVIRKDSKTYYRIVTGPILESIGVRGTSASTLAEARKAVREIMTNARLNLYEVSVSYKINR